jgi:hypothetical protein
VISSNLDKYQGKIQPREKYTSRTTDASSNEEGATSDSDEDWSSRLIQDFEFCLDKKSQEIIRGIEVPDLTAKIWAVTVF